MSESGRKARVRFPFGDGGKDRPGQIQAVEQQSRVRFFEMWIFEEGEQDFLRLLVNEGL